jgi:hypothetical protein
MFCNIIGAAPHYRPLGFVRYRTEVPYWGVLSILKSKVSLLIRIFS